MNDKFFDSAVVAAASRTARRVGWLLASRFAHASAVEEVHEIVIVFVRAYQYSCSVIRFHGTIAVHGLVHVFGSEIVNS